MKKVLYILSLLMLISCEGQTTSPSFNSNNQSISKTTFNKVYEKLTNGCSIIGDYTFKEDEYTLTYTYSSFSSKSILLKFYDDETFDVVSNVTYFKDEDGYAYKEELSLQNEVSKFKQNFIFDTKYYNPFLLLNEYDLNDLNESKIDLFLNCFMDSNISNLVEEVAFTIENDTLTSFKISGEGINGEFLLDYEDLIIEHLTPLVANEKQIELNNILSTYNAPIVVDIDNVNEFTKNRTYFTGNSIYYQESLNNDEIGDYDTWINRIEGEDYLLDLYYTGSYWEDEGNSFKYYDEEKLDLSKINGVFFEYKEEDNKYTSIDYRVCELFAPKSYCNAFIEDDLVADIYIKDDKIEKVEVYNNASYYIITYSEFTSLPFNLMDVPTVL